MQHFTRMEQAANPQSCSQRPNKGLTPNPDNVLPSFVQVRPEVHLAFHDYVDEQHMSLALLGSNGKSSLCKLVRSSDARILSAACQHLLQLCSKDPLLADTTKEAFRMYMLVCPLPFLIVRVLLAQMHEKCHHVHMWCMYVGLSCLAALTSPEFGRAFSRSSDCSSFSKCSRSLIFRCGCLHTDSPL
jgi:hypothetical protein